MLCRSGKGPGTCVPSRSATTMLWRRPSGGCWPRTCCPSGHRISSLGNDLASGWTVDTAADLFYGVTLRSPWRDLTGTRDWSANQYAPRMSHFLRRALIA